MASLQTEERVAKAHARSINADTVASAARALMYLAIAFAAFAIASRVLP